MTTMNSLRRTYMVTMIATAIDRRTNKKGSYENTDGCSAKNG